MSSKTKLLLTPEISSKPKSVVSVRKNFEGFEKSNEISTSYQNSKPQSELDLSWIEERLKTKRVNIAWQRYLEQKLGQKCDY